MAYKVVPVASLWEPQDEPRPTAQVEAQLNAAEAKGWRVVAIVPRHKSREIYADDSDPEGPWLVLHKKDKKSTA